MVTRRRARRRSPPHRRRKLKVLSPPRARVRPIRRRSCRAEC
jgi:hypothetical protein